LTTLLGSLIYNLRCISKAIAFRIGPETHFDIAIALGFPFKRSMVRGITKDASSK